MNYDELLQDLSAVGAEDENATGAVIGFCIGMAVPMFPGAPGPITPSMIKEAILRDGKVMEFINELNNTLILNIDELTTALFKTAYARQAMICGDNFEAIRDFNAYQFLGYGDTKGCITLANKLVPYVKNYLNK